MSESYEPNPNALPASPYDTAILSQRDLGLRVPINYVISPGVAFTAACFPFLQYEDHDSAICLSNLLAEGFQRFEVDLYWDQARKLWSFCPVAVPVATQSATRSSTATSTSSPSSSSTTTAKLTSDLISSDLIARQAISASADADSNSAASSISSTSTSNPTSSITLTPSPLGTILPSISVSPNTPNEPPYSLGSYTCTSTINLSTLLSQLLDYFQKTQNTLAAHLVSVKINLHAAKSNSNTNNPAPEPSTLPSNQQMLGSLFSANLSAYLYTPGDLKGDRENLNNSWYSVAEIYRPVQYYYATSINENKIVSTQDGWPSTSYLEFSQGKRLLVQFGSVDSQMANYNFTSDEKTIFSQGYINNDRSSNVSVAPDGNVTSGCYLLNDTEDLSQVNSSWATAANLFGFSYPTTPNSDITNLLNLTSDLTACGISPTLNTTLLNSTAETNYLPYQNFTHATIWSWALNEPRNFSSDIDSSDSLFRCASLSAITNRWQVADCSTRLYAACRVPSQPYNWTITTYSISYSYAHAACPSPYQFTVPSTSLENTHLIRTLQTLRSSRDLDSSHPSIWVDFNSLDTRNCWVSGGPNATCPYSGQANELDLHEREVLVPTVAVIIVFVLAILVTMAEILGSGLRGRKTRKRERRNEGGWVYEGVPS